MGDLTDADIDYFDPEIEKMRPRVALRTPLGSGLGGGGGGGVSSGRASSTLRSFRATSMAPPSSTFKGFEEEAADDFGSSAFRARARRAMSEARDMESEFGRGAYEPNYTSSGGRYNYSYAAPPSSYNRSYNMSSSNYSSGISNLLGRHEKFDLSFLNPTSPFGDERIRTFGGPRTFTETWSKPVYNDFLSNVRSNSNFKRNFSDDADYSYGKSFFGMDSSSSANNLKSSSRLGRTSSYDYDYGKSSAANRDYSGGLFDSSSNSKLSKLYGNYRKSRAERNAATSALEDYATSAVVGETTLGARFDKYVDRLVNNYFQRYYGGESKFFEKKATGKRNPKFAHYWVR